MSTRTHETARGASLSHYLRTSSSEEKSRFFEAALKRAAEQQRSVVREAGMSLAR